LREELTAITAQEERPINDQHLMDAVLNCPHSITSESVTLHFSQTQKDGHNALSQLRHRMAGYDMAARQREMQLLSEIEALEKLALANLKQQGAEATPIAWYVTGCSTMLDEHDAKSEAKRCGGSAKAVPLYTAPPAHADARDAARYHWLRNQMLGVDFDWCGNGITALVFEVPDGCAYSRNCDQSIDTAIAAQTKHGGDINA
jgi:hypothetical protein